ncbi:MAG: ATP-binding protein, partial [Desulfotomaculales bacterium]
GVILSARGNLHQNSDLTTRFYAMFVILSWVWHRFGLKMKGRKKIVVVDEGWMFARWPESACFLETLARRGRKHRTGLVIASQQVEEFLSREEGRSVLANCPTQFILGQNPTVAEQVVEVFKLPAGLGERLQTFGNGRCFLTMGANTAEVQVVVLPYEFEHVRTDAGQV